MIKLYKVVIGLEVHCELKTKTKNFSNSLNTYSTVPNEHVATVDMGLPGILPVPNKEAVRKALKTAMALNCQNPDEVIFDRKNYFYPDLPKGYQITQVTKPCGINGYLDIFVGEEEKRIFIHQLHLEEDTASLEHYNNYSLIDYNRSGIPLMEIVTEPCITSSDEAISFLEALRNVFLYCQVSDARSDKGQMRCDVNISLMKPDDDKLGTKVEMKNINAFTSVRAAIDYEIKRQTEILDQGGKVKQETRRIDEDGKTYPMREKVDAIDYKYFIEPNIPPVKLSKEYLDSIRQEIPVLEFERIKNYQQDYGLSFYDASVLAKDKGIADYFEAVIKEGAKPIESVANWVMTVVLGTLNKLDITLEEFFITPKMLAGVLKLINEDKISLNHGKKIIYQAIKEKKDPIDIIKENNIEQIKDDQIILQHVKDALEENPLQVDQYIKEGKDYVKNFFVGKVMQKTNRQADPVLTLDLIVKELEKRKDNERK